MTTAIPFETITVRKGTSSFFTVPSPDGKYLFAAEDEGAIHVWNLETGHKEARWQATSWIAAASFSPDGRRAVIGECQPCIIDMATQTDLGETPWVSGKRLNNVRFAPDSRHFATSSSDHVVQYWDADTRTAVAELSHDGSEVASLTFSGDGRFLAAGLSDHRVRLWPMP
jgi:WD40 repeat protein